MGNDETKKKNHKFEIDCGFRIYKMYNNSPFKMLGVKELSDFIIPPKELSSSNLTFEYWLKERKNEKININIYSLLTRKMKEYEITVNEDDNNGGILGCEVNYENYISAQTKLLHVLSIKNKSYAQDNVFLIKDQDYIIGLKSLNDGKFYSLNNDKFKELIIEFSEVLNRNKGKECELYVYNVKRGAKVILIKLPNNKKFSLGCDVAYGKIHEFPMKSENDEDEEKKGLKD